MIRLDNVSWTAGRFRLDEVSFEVPPSCYAALMGATGSGKTSLLEIIGGLRAPTRGRVWVAGNDVTDLPPRSRRIGYVPQDGALFPAMRIGNQIGFAPRIAGRSPAEIEATVSRLAVDMHISHLLDRYPQGLSGGEKQRAALARALAAAPQVLLLDEPLSALDEPLRDDLTAMLRRMQQDQDLTVLHVTHSLREASQCADVVLSLAGGRVSAL